LDQKQKHPLGQEFNLFYEKRKEKEKKLLRWSIGLGPSKNVTTSRGLKKRVFIEKIKIRKKYEKRGIRILQVYETSISKNIKRKREKWKCCACKNSTLERRKKKRAT